MSFAEITAITSKLSVMNGVAKGAGYTRRGSLVLPTTTQSNRMALPGSQSKFLVDALGRSTKTNEQLALEMLRVKVNIYAFCFVHVPVFINRIS